MITFMYDTRDIERKIGSTSMYMSALVGKLGSDIQIEMIAAEFMIKKFKSHLDDLARTDPTLHHAYEQGRAGEPSSRLYDLRAVPSRENVLIELFFLPSQKEDDGHIFVNRAEVLEEGQGMVIEPVNASVLHFEYEGNEVFTTRVVIEAGSQSTTGRVEEEFNNYMQHMAEIDLSESGFLTMMNVLVEKEIEAFGAKIGGMGITTGVASAANRSVKRIAKGLKKVVGL